MRVQQMMAAHRDVQGKSNDVLLRSIEECYGRAQTCTSYADACLVEEEVADLQQCIRLNLDCADICLPLRWDRHPPNRLERNWHRRSAKRLRYCVPPLGRRMRAPC